MRLSRLEAEAARRSCGAMAILEVILAGHGGEVLNDEVLSSGSLNRFRASFTNA